MAGATSVESASIGSTPVIVTDVTGFGEIVREKYYEGLSGGILEGLGKLFPPGTTAYVYPIRDRGQVITLDDMPIADHLRPLIAYLRERGHVVSADDYEPSRLEG